MIINQNINSPLSIDDTNLDWEINWNYYFPEGESRIEVEVNFWNFIDGEQHNKNHRVLYITGGVANANDNANFSKNAIKTQFFNNHPYLEK